MKALTEAQLNQLLSAEARNPLRFYRASPIIARFLQDESDAALLRGPNQAGKTTALAAWVIAMMLGLDIFSDVWRVRHPPPNVGWIVCADWQAVATVATKIMDLLPAEELHPETTFTSKRGFGSATLILKNGSRAIFKTHRQKPDSLEGATLDWVLIDEPCSEELWSPIAARVSHKQGPIRIGFCPVGSVPFGYMRRMVESGEISEHHYSLSVENCWPVGAMAPFKNQGAIDAFTARCRAAQRPQRVGGEWEGPPDEAFHPDFNPEVHVTDAIPAGEQWSVGIGVDYGTDVGKPAVALVAVRGGQQLNPKFWFMDEAACPADSTWSIDDIATQIVSILERNNLSWRQVDKWRGDRIVYGRGNAVQSNGRLWGALRHLLKIPSSAGNLFSVPRKAPGTVHAVSDLINEAFMQNRATVRKRCHRLREYFLLFDGDKRHPTKDIGDAARYAIMGLVHPRWWSGRVEDR